MTDETKGDGMTRAEIEVLWSNIWQWEESHSSDLEDDLIALRDYIDAHLAAQSAMRVDEAMARKLGDEYFRLCKLHGDKPMAHGFWTSHLFAALQAAIGKPQP